MTARQHASIVDFTPDDEQALQAFCQKIFDEQKWPLRFLDDSITDAYDLSGGDSFLLVKQNNRIMGCCGLKKLSVDKALIVRFFIAVELRGTGLAQRLFDEIVRRGRNQGYKNFVLDVAHDNARAIHFYEKQGIQPFRPKPHSRWPESAAGEEKYVRYLQKKV